MHLGALLKKVMSWYNPSQKEATEAYAYYQNKYYSAASQYNALMRQEQTYFSQKSAATMKMGDFSAQKVNFEKRLEGIIEIIKMLEGSRGCFATNVPSTISKATSTIQKTEISYKQSIKLTGGMAAANLETAFDVKTVEGDQRSALALQAYKAEKIRLEQSIADLKSQITSLSNQISILSKQISACSVSKASYKNIMNSSAYEMNHYRKHMY